MSLFVNSLSKFEKFYSGIYSQRWPAILDSLKNQEQHKARQVARLNYFSKFASGLSPTYSMDPASIVVAEALAIFMGHRILDLCAAPGGKTLILYEHLFEKIPQAELGLATEDFFQWSNEYSAQRRERLTRVLKEYIPQDMRGHIWVKGQDGQTFGLKHGDKFDTALVDAPCSGERHLLENAKELELWTEARSKHLAVRQYTLLCSALQAIQINGVIAYSTCALSPLENDEILRKLNKKKKNEFTFVPTALTEESLAPILKKYSIQLEKTEFGFQILPDQNQGAGPMYFSLIRKA